MGGFGSSRWGSYTKRRTVEGCRVLRARDLAAKLREEGALGEPFTATVEAGSGAQTLAVTVEAARLGGLRLWLLCPRCGARRLALYQVGGTFACRVCHGLAYTSSQENHKFDRLFRMLARDMGPGWTPQAVKAALEERETPRTIRLLDAVFAGARDMERVARKMKMGKRGEDRD